MRRNVLALVACALTALPLVAQAQSREVTGRITTAGTATPLQDATVTVIGQQVAARTNERGEYRLRVTGGDVTLTARALGYKRQEQRVPASSQTANFVLERDVLQLEGMTITGAATAVDRRNAGVAVVSVSGEDISRVPAPSLESAMQGKVVGAQISMNNGAPGGGGQIQIRNASSLLGRIDPLYVVDGVIISNAVRSNGLSTITGSLNAPYTNGSFAVFGGTSGTVTVDNANGQVSASVPAPRCRPTRCPTIRCPAASRPRRRAGRSVRPSVTPPW